VSLQPQLSSPSDPRRLPARRHPRRQDRFLPGATLVAAEVILALTLVAGYALSTLPSR